MQSYFTANTRQIDFPFHSLLHTYSKFLIYQRKFYTNGVQQQDSQSSCLAGYSLFCFVLWPNSSFFKGYLASHGQLVFLTRSYTKNTTEETSTSSCQIY